MTTTLKRPVVGNVKIVSGLLSMTGSVYTAAKPNIQKAESFKMACPEHPETPHGVKQRYVCEKNPDSGKTHLPADCLSMREVGDTCVIVPKEAKEEAKKSELPERTLELQFHPFDASTTFAAGQAVIFQPDDASQFYATLLESIDERGVVETDDGPKMAVGMVSLRKGTEMFCRLERWGNQLVIRELLRPQDVDAFPEVDATVDTKLLAMFRSLVSATSEEFDPDAYRATVRDRIAALTESVADGTTPVVIPTKSPVLDMQAQLEAMLAAVKKD